MNRFVYIIYDEFTAEIFAIFNTEEECVSRYVEQYEGFVNVNWMGVNLRFVLKEFYHIGNN